MRHRPADQRGGDVVEEGREYEHDREQRKAAGPVVRQDSRQRVGQAALLEMRRKQRETDQQQEQVCEKHPFMGELRGKAR